MRMRKVLRGDAAVALYRRVFLDLALDRMSLVVGSLQDIARARNEITSDPDFPGGPLAPIGVRKQIDNHEIVVGAAVRSPTFERACQEAGAYIWNTRSPLVIQMTPDVLISLVERVLGPGAAQALRQYVESKTEDDSDSTRASQPGGPGEPRSG